MIPARESISTSEVQSAALSSYATRFARDGYALLPCVFSRSDVELLRSAIERVADSDAVRKEKSVYGIRNLLQLVPEVAMVSVRPEIWPFVAAILGEDAFATRAILFNKTPDANWALGWHQDSVIAVAEKREMPRFRAWGLKAGVWQVQPPPEILSRMLALRIHLDDCDAGNGALRVIPGSHCHGWLDDEIDAWKRRVPEVICESPAGGVFTMCPTILHASSRALQPANRRVIHIEYANATLPDGLQWHTQIRPTSPAAQYNSRR